MYKIYAYHFNKSSYFFVKVKVKEKAQHLMTHHPVILHAIATAATL